MARLGRPKGDNNKEYIYSMRLDAQARIRLEAYCKAMNVIKSEAIRQAISNLEENRVMANIYIIQEERESSVNCGIQGVWSTWDAAVSCLRELVERNELFDNDSVVDYDMGIAESDPLYCNEEYCNYKITCYNLN